MASFRQIKIGDNKVLAEIIRSIFKEFGVDKPGTIYTDPTTDDLFGLFQKSGSVCWVATENEEILGCCGIYPTDGLPRGCVELVKFYLRKDFRGRSLGKELMKLCIDSAKQLNYSSIYLESLPEFSNALRLYESAGFKKVDSRLGNSGHFACDVLMLLRL